MSKENLKFLMELLFLKDRKKQLLKYQLKQFPRYTVTQTNLLNFPITLIDSASFLFMYSEIFEQEIYKFKAETKSPNILDLGANIGLSIIYFKQLYPQSKIIAFEPDPKVFSILSQNIKNLKLDNIELINKAVWTAETTLEFMSEGADGGRLVCLDSQFTKYQIETVQLCKYLTQPIDFLKMDIEGAETQVLCDCKDLLKNVRNLFIEYHSFVEQKQTLHTIINILSDNGFRIHIHPPVTSPQPFYERKIHMGMDMQLNIFAFRV